MELSCLGQSTINLGRLSLILNPVAKPNPDAHQTLVRYIHHGFRLNSGFNAGHEEGAPWATESINDSEHHLIGFTHHFTEFTVSDRAANPSMTIHFFSQRLEQLFNNPPLTIRAQAKVNFVCMARKGLLHPAGGSVVTQVQLRISPISGCVFPGAHQRMLQDRQLVRIIPNIVE